MVFMKISTMSIVVGGTICNADCPFCVSRMTSTVGLPVRQPKKEVLRWDNLEFARKFADCKGVDTFLITGKGEPTLYGDTITSVLSALQKSPAAFRELQTNAIPLAMKKQDHESALEAWRVLGLTTIAISVVHHDDAMNKKIYIDGGKDKVSTGVYPPLVETIKWLKSFGFSIRLSCIMNKGYIDSPLGVIQMADFARENGVTQLTCTPVTQPFDPKDLVAAKWVDEHGLYGDVSLIRKMLDDKAHFQFQLPHGARIYDLDGQNVALSNCLTETKDNDPDSIRQLIYFLHDGSLRWSWQYEGARIL